MKANKSVTFYSDQYQWLNPLQIGITTVLKLSTEKNTIEQVCKILNQLESDDVLDFVKEFYKTGLQRFGDKWYYADLLTALFSATNVLQPQNYLEIGVFHGRSSAIVADVAPYCNIYGFDLWIEDYADLDNHGPSIVRNQLQRVGHKGEITLVSGDSKDTIPNFLEQNPDIYFDLINVDGDHSEGGARQDLHNVFPRVKIGGILVFDDICHPKHPWLERVWDETIGTNPNFLSTKFTEVGNGIAMAIRRSNNKMVDKVDGDAAERIIYLNRLLEEVNVQQNSLQIEGKEKDGVISHLTDELELVKTDRLAKQEIINRLQNELAEVRTDRLAKQEIINRLQNELAEVRTDRLAKQEVVDRLQNELAEVRTDRLAKQEVVDRLQNELAEVRTDQNAKQEVVDRLQNELAEVRTDQNAKQEVINRLQNMLEAKEAVIQQLGSDLDDYASLGWGLARSVTVRARKLRNKKVHSHASDQINAQKAEIVPVVKSSPPIHVALDILQINFGVSGGVEVYMKTLVRAITQEMAGAIKLTLLHKPEQVYPLQTLFGDQVSYHEFGPTPIAAVGAKIRDKLNNNTEPVHLNISFARLAEELAVDVLHSPVQIFSQTDFSIPGILNLHDLQHLHFPENFTSGDIEARNQLYGQSAALASVIIASSEFVRQDIINNMGISSAKVQTIPVAVDPDIENGLKTFTPEQAHQYYGLPKMFGFYPAQFWLHKNHARLIEALAIVRAKSVDHNFKLVFSGYRDLSGWTAVEEALGKFDMQDHVLFLDFVPTDHLAAIYRSATFCVMPSLFEASSYPVIEAQMLGCPAMCSNITSLPELMANDAGLLFDPYSPEDMADKMLRWLDNSDDRLAYAKRGQKRAKQNHSLTAYAKNIQTLYEKVLEFHNVAKQ